MRTSRLAQDTARLVHALSPRKSAANGTTRTLRSRTATSTAASTVKNSSPSISSQGPSDDEYGTELSSSLSSLPSRKRKRGETTHSTAVETEVLESFESHASPRKSHSAQNGKPKKAKRQPAKWINAPDGSVEVQPPPNWLEVYNVTKDMRRRWPAPVDTMGCESLAEDKASPRDQRFQTLVALMLSSQTKDTVTSVAIQNLQQHLPGGLTLKSILAVPPETLNELIMKVGFHNNKTRYIKATAQILVEQHKSDIPDTIEGLMALPGVGPKMAYLCMSAAWDRHEGIGVDVHVHRITNLWGWHKTKTPEETRAALESWLPKEKWHDINHLLVGFGQTWCPPVGRKCDMCYLADRGLCPSADVNKAAKRTVKLETVVKKKEEEGEVAELKREIKDEAEVEGRIAEVKEEINDEIEVEGGAVTGEGFENVPLVGEIADIEDIGRPARRRSRRVTAA